MFISTESGLVVSVSVIVGAGTVFVCCGAGPGD